MQKDIFIIKKLSKMTELTVIQKIDAIAMKQKYRWKKEERTLFKEKKWISKNFGMWLN